jgi:hypothetical protein
MAGRLEIGKHYYAATPAGLFKVRVGMPETVRGVVKHYSCFGHEVDDEGEVIPGMMGIDVNMKTKYLFRLDEQHKARKAVFQLKLGA